MIASTDKVVNAAYQAEGEPLWGVQFHPEVFHSVQGTLLLKNFVVDICGSKQDRAGVYAGLRCAWYNDGDLLCTEYGGREIYENP